MTPIVSIVQAAQRTRQLTSEQACRINILLWQGQATETDLEALDSLTEALVQGQIVAADGVCG